METCEMKDYLELQKKMKEKQLALIEKRVRIAAEIEKKNIGVSWEEMQEFLGHSYENLEGVEERGEQLIDPDLFIRISADLVNTEKRIKRDIEKIKIELNKLSKE